MDKLLEYIDDIKEKISDQEYVDIMNTLGEVQSLTDLYVVKYIKVDMKPAFDDGNSESGMENKMTFKIRKKLCKLTERTLRDMNDINEQNKIHDGDFMMRNGDDILTLDIFYPRSIVQTPLPIYNTDDYNEESNRCNVCFAKYLILNITKKNTFEV